MVLITGCGVSQFYKAPEVSQALMKNSQQLETIKVNVENDFLDKQAFYKQFQAKNKNKNAFVMEDLTWRLTDLKAKRDSVLAKSAAIKKVNDDLLTHIGEQEKVVESDPLFKEIKSFEKLKEEQAGPLITEYEKYKAASTEFTRFVIFTGSGLKKSTRIKR